MSLAGLETMHPHDFMWHDGESIWCPKPPPVRFINEGGPHGVKHLIAMAVTAACTVIVTLVSVYVSAR